MGNLFKCEYMYISHFFSVGDFYELWLILCGGIGIAFMLTISGCVQKIFAKKKNPILPFIRLSTQIDLPIDNARRQSVYFASNLFHFGSSFIPFVQM